MYWRCRWNWASVVVVNDYDIEGNGGRFKSRTIILRVRCGDNGMSPKSAQVLHNRKLSSRDAKAKGFVPAG
jgi:hypothetical protein